ncbi:hypothetical protein EVAR_100124_1 [Eumeta japonica]|uniref:Uncharacterized protein n=1 Tax=Eumeta variegata TaxID=151549 RepID=A0A4C1ZLT2_EUMVA|nr:hypothetical protein EVAR_100124_1 [Eumeta japonica]
MLRRERVRVRRFCCEISHSNAVRVTSALPASWEGIGYLMERDQINKKDERGRAPEFAHNGRKAIAEAGAYRPYSVRMWYFTGGVIFVLQPS